VSVLFYVRQDWIARDIVCLHTHVHADMYRFTFTHFDIHTQIKKHKCMDAWMHISACPAREHSYAYAYIHAYIYTYTNHLHAYIHTDIHACMHKPHTYIHTYIHTQPTYMHACIHTYTHVHTYIHTHIYIHTYMPKQPTCIHT
jgi:hypothetical protein